LIRPERDSSLVANTPGNFILYLNGVTGFDRFPMQVTFIQDSEGHSEYFRTRSFVASLQSKDVSEPGRPGGRGYSLARSVDRPRFERITLLPEPQFPFITPPVP
jgi:hypothetical protein